MTSFMKRLHWTYWAFSIVFGCFVPELLVYLDLNQMVRFGLIYSILFSVIAGFIGTLVKHHQKPIWVLLVWPISFLVGVISSEPMDTTVFALIYLCISYLSYGFSKTYK